MRDYLTLTKPRISFLFALTGVAALMVDGRVFADLWIMPILGIAIFMVGGGANALNQFFEREVDKQMARTAKKRPLPQGKITATNALIFSIAISLAGLVLLFIWGNIWASLSGLGTIIFYSFYYTLWLKPKTPYNIVIGGAAGAMGPIIAWLAIAGSLSWEPIVMFALVFMWTPPHFWALALCCKDDYQRVSYPMLPLVKGDAFTRKQIVAYSLFLLPISIPLFWAENLGLFYLIVAVVLGVFFIWGAYQLSQIHQKRVYWRFFGYSIVYLFLLFISMMIDSALG